MRTAAVATLLGLCARPGDGAANATYVVGPEGVDYAEADFFCTQIGAALATIADAAETSWRDRPAPIRTLPLIAGWAL